MHAYETPTYTKRRGELEEYFDRTASAAWAKLTSDAPVGRIRATVRAGRENMRATLLSWLPADLTGKRLLDAGCGPGVLSIEAARRGADVVAVDLAGSLLDVARTRLPDDIDPAKIDFRVGDMLDANLGTFDHVVVMDALIHYKRDDIVAAVGALAARTRSSIVFTVAPRTPALAAMHAVGQWLPSNDKAPGIIPVGAKDLSRALACSDLLTGWSQGRTARVASGFYKSQAMEVTRDTLGGEPS
jgi:magnesium-protoporphyrin O-methyltransferase